MAYVNVVDWKPEQVTEWLKGIDPVVVPYIHSFVNNEVDGQQLLNLRSDDLQHLGITKVGHQEIVLEAIEHLSNFHYELDRENIQVLALRLSCQAHSLQSALSEKEQLSRGPGVSTQTLADVANIIACIKPLVHWLDRPPFCDLPPYQELRTILLSHGLNIATCAQRDRFAEQPVDNIRKHCQDLAQLADSVIQDCNDPLILQPSSLDLATIKKKAGDEVGFFLAPSLSGTHQIVEIKLQAPAHQSGKIEEGDEIVQVNYQTVVGWRAKAVWHLVQEASTQVFLTLKKRPKHSNVYGQIYIKPYRLPSRKRNPPFHRWNSVLNLPSPRPELLTIPYFELPLPTPSRFEASSVPLEARPHSSSSSSSSHHGSVGTNSSDEDDSAFAADNEGMGRGTSSPASVRMILPRSRSVVQRRATVSGASPTAKHPPHGFDQLLAEIQREMQRRGLPSLPKRPDDTAELRGKSESALSLRITRPNTVLGSLGSESPLSPLGPTFRPRFHQASNSSKTSPPKVPQKPRITPERQLSVKDISLVGTVSLTVHPQQIPSQECAQPKSLDESMVPAPRMSTKTYQSGTPGPPVTPRSPVTPLPVVTPRSPVIPPPTVTPRSSITPPSTTSTRNLVTPPPIVTPRSSITPPSTSSSSSHLSGPTTPSQPSIPHNNSPVYSPGPPLSLLGRPSKGLAQVPDLLPVHVPSMTSIYSGNPPTPSITVEESATGDTLHERAVDCSPIPPPRPASTLRGAPATTPKSNQSQSPSSGGVTKGLVARTVSRTKQRLSPRSDRKKTANLLSKGRNVACKQLVEVDCEGWLLQRARAAAGASWKRTWFVLKDAALFGFPDPQAKKASTLISLPGFTAAAAPEVKSRQFAFKVYHMGTTFYLAAGCAEELTRWLSCLGTATLVRLPSGNAAPYFSETEDEEQPVRPPARAASSGNVHAEPEMKSELFGSLRRLAGGWRTEEGATSLDRKYLPRLLRQEEVVPVPTAHFRSYRRVDRDRGSTGGARPDHSKTLPSRLGSQHQQRFTSVESVTASTAPSGSTTSLPAAESASESSRHLAAIAKKSDGTEIPHHDTEKNPRRMLRLFSPGLSRKFGGGLPKNPAVKAEEDATPTLLGSPKLHRALFKGRRQHHHPTQLPKPSTPLQPGRIPPTLPEDSPPPIPVSIPDNIVPDYPGLEYPPVFEPGTYTLNPATREQFRSTNPRVLTNRMLLFPKSKDACWPTHSTNLVGTSSHHSPQPAAVAVASTSHQPMVTPRRPVALSNQTSETLVWRPSAQPLPQSPAIPEQQTTSTSQQSSETHVLLSSLDLLSSTNV